MEIKYLFQEIPKGVDYSKIERLVLSRNEVREESKKRGSFFLGKLKGVLSRLSGLLSVERMQERSQSQIADNRLSGIKL